MASALLEVLPIELLTEIYKYLPRTDRMSCSMVSQKWKDALDRKDLWKKIILHIDKDFLGRCSLRFSVSPKLVPMLSRT